MTKTPSGQSLKEISHQQPLDVRPQLSTLLPREHPSKQALAKAYRAHGHQMQEKVDHYSTVSRWIRRAEEEGA